MQAIDTFALAKHTGAYEQWPQHTPLLANGADTGKCVPGYVIEAQYRCGEHYLLITSWDCPFEEAQTFLLLSSSFDVLYEETLGAPYASYLLMSHAPVGRDAVLCQSSGFLDVMVRVDPNGWLVVQKLDRTTGKPWPLTTAGVITRLKARLRSLFKA
jgi:hypothetical protein